MKNCVGHLLSAATASTASGLLLVSLPASSLSASTTALTAAGPGMHCCHLGCLSNISTSESRMQSSLGSLLRNKQLKKALFSWPSGQRRGNSASSSHGKWRQLVELFNTLDVC
jgi:hypothetical protein